MYVYVCMYECMYVCIYVCISVYTFIEYIINLTYTWSGNIYLTWSGKFGNQGVGMFEVISVVGGK